MLHLLPSGSETMCTVISDQIKTISTKPAHVFSVMFRFGIKYLGTNHLGFSPTALQILREKWKEDSHPLATSLIKFTVICIHYLPLQSPVVSCILLKAVLANEWIH